MNTRLRVIIATLFAMLGIVASTPPANADQSCTFGVCGVITHYAPDNGYDAPFLVECGLAKYIHEGESSSSKCRDVDWIYVNAGTQIRCLDPGGWVIRWDATGWHHLVDIGGGICVYELD